MTDAEMNPSISLADMRQLDKPAIGQWSSTELLSFNGVRVRHTLMKEVEAQWHVHETSDEFFMVLSGEVRVDTRSACGLVKSHLLHQGQMVAIHAGTQHRAACDHCATLIVMDAIPARS